MSDDFSNCRNCGVELQPANSFTCANCGRNDLCILHKGSGSGLCSVCLDRFRKRLIYPTFAIICSVLLIFSPYMFAKIPFFLIVPVILFLPFWLMIEASRPVITYSKLKKIFMNTALLSVFLIFILIVLWQINQFKSFIRISAGLASTAFLILGVVLFLLGFIYVLSTSLGRLGITLFNYDYPEETSILLKKAGKDPEMIGTLKWDLKWITGINFIYGFIFLYLYISSSG
ncbi:hypothetical protein KKB99_07380 [bacterium]|nr:hypothetical protein [bacterium]